MIGKLQTQLVVTWPEPMILIERAQLRALIEVATAAGAYVNAHIALEGEARCDADGGVRLIRALARVGVDR